MGKLNSYNACIYARLSRDDGDKLESDSIINQKALKPLSGIFCRNIRRSMRFQRKPMTDTLVSTLTDRRFRK